MTKKVAPRQAAKAADAQMLLLLNILGGTVALSPLTTCIMTKQIRSRAATTSSAMILPLFQGYLPPPHCRASSRHTTPGRNTAVPGRSISLIFCQVVKPVTFLRSGDLKKKKRKIAVTAPNGRLM
jgi:hypothetical protein